MALWGSFIIFMETLSSLVGVELDNRRCLVWEHQ
jgi:hypothetical protein